MYKICLYNSGQETLIHYPTVNKEAPHLFKMDLQEKDNDVDTFSFSIDIKNAGYNSLKEFKTKVKIIDTRDNSIRFTGRLIKAPEKMDSNGFYKDVDCESALAYLLDSNARDQTYLTADVSSALQDLLNRHNAIVEDEKKIYLGTVNVTGSIAYTCQYESTLNAMINVLKDIKCHLQIREVDGKLYLDCLKELSSTIVEVRLGKNMKEMIKTYDPTGIGTRIIPLGANNLTIADANGGIDYIEDLTAKGLFGIIEKTVEYSDITDATELKNKVTTDLNNYTQPNLTFEINALDLSTLSGVSANTFKKGLNLHIINSIMGIDDIYTIVEADADLTQIYNPKLTISNIPTTIQDIINNMSNNSINNNSVHNKVQVGDDFGIRVVAEAKKAVLTMNGTEGISIENDKKKVFTLDINGNTVANDGTFNDITANRGTYTDIVTNSMVANQAKTSNTENYIILQDQYLDFYHNNSRRMRLGFTPSSTNSARIEFYPESGLGSDPSAVLSVTGSGDLLLDGQTIATQEWVNANKSSGGGTSGS